MRAASKGSLGEPGTPELRVSGLHGYCSLMEWKEKKSQTATLSSLKKGVLYPFAYLAGALYQLRFKHMLQNPLYSIPMLVVSLQFFSQVFKRGRRPTIQGHSGRLRKHSEV